MPAGHESELAGHATVPAAEALPLFLAAVILYVKTVTGGADIGAGTAAEAGVIEAFPGGIIKALFRTFRHSFQG